MAGCSAAAAFVLRGRVGTEKAVLEVSGGNLDVTSIDLLTTFSLEALDIDATSWKSLENWRTTASGLRAEAARQ